MSPNNHIEERDGALYVCGSRISLDSIVYAFRDGASPETIQQNFAGLRLAAVYGAITYYLDHQSEVDQYLLKGKAEWAELERQGTPAPPELLARMERARASAMSTGR